MTNAVLTDNDRKEALSFVYLNALSAIAGYTCQGGPQPDRNSVDAIVWGGSPTSPQIHVQLKSTSSPDRKSDGLHFQLSRKNYNDLRNSHNPFILVILELPEHQSDWLDCGPERLIMRRCAWWLSLKGHPEIETDSRVVVIPESQRLDVDALKLLMDMARQRSL